MKRLSFVLLLCFFPGCSRHIDLPEADRVSSIRVFIKIPPAEWRQRGAFITDRERIREFIDVVGKARSTGQQAGDLIGMITIDVKSGDGGELGLTEELGIVSEGNVLDLPPDWLRDYLLDAGVIEARDHPERRKADGNIEAGEG
jgi:hypothetical protein